MKIKEAKIGLITYEFPHSKTFEILKKLIRKKYKVVLLFVGFKKIKKNYDSDYRPNQFKKKISLKNFKIERRYFSSKKDILDLKYVLIGGSGLIDKKKIVPKKIINCHSGLIPLSRGLDSVKWSIFRGNLVGNTLHFIDSNIDKGTIIHQEITKFNPKCSLKQFYKVHYEKEINMLANFEKFIKDGKKFKLNISFPKKRFPKKYEKQLVEKFASYKKNFKYLKKNLNINNVRKKFFIHETSIVDQNVKIGEGTKIWHWCHISKNSKIGKNCVLGQNVYIGENVFIGDNVRIQNNVSIFEGIKINDSVFIGPSAVFTNVKKPKALKKQTYVSTILEKGATIGANSTIICGNKIGKNSFVGAGSVVTKNVKERTTVVGNPAKVLKI
jgi:UDP-2-acetamido-3-amino-2,3-dideoxy-glucuronate N-acetyltransferase